MRNMAEPQSTRQGGNSGGAERPETGDLEAGGADGSGKQAGFIQQFLYDREYPAVTGKVKKYGVWPPAGRKAGENYANRAVSGVLAPVDSGAAAYAGGGVKRSTALITRSTLPRATRPG